MTRAQTLLLALVLVLGGFLVLWDLPNERRQQEQLAQDEQLISLSVSQVDTISLRRPDGEVLIARSAGGWALLKPVREEALPDAVEAWLGGVTGARRIRTLEEASGPGSFDAYGVGSQDPSVLQLRLASARGRQSHLWIGRTNPDAIGAYARSEGSDSIELVNQGLKALVEASHNTFRRYELFRLGAAPIDWLDVATASGTRYRFERDERDLWYRADEEGRRPVKRYRIRELTFLLDEERVEEYVSDHLGSRDWSAYGLDDPLGDLRFGTPEGEHRLRLGNVDSDGRFFARRDEESSLLAFSTQLLTLLEQPLDDLLETNPILGNYDRLDSLRVQWTGNDPMTLVRTGGEWTPRLPPDWEGDASLVPTAVTNALQGLERLESPQSMILAQGNSPADIAPVHAATVRLFWPERAVVFDLRWRSGQDFHWLQRQDDATLHWISRDLFLRLRALGLVLGAVQLEG